jgi:hypothetical protein
MHGARLDELRRFDWAPRSAAPKRGLRERLAADGPLLLEVA